MGSGAGEVCGGEVGQVGSLSTGQAHAASTGTREGPQGLCYQLVQGRRGGGGSSASPLPIPNLRSSPEGSLLHRFPRLSVTCVPSVPADALS